MAQFDVYPNPFADPRGAVPFVVDVQSGLLDQLTTRLVVPLTRLGNQGTRLPLNLCPSVEVAGETFSLLPHQSAPALARLLKEPVGSVSNRRGDIIAAMDAVLSGV